MHVVFFGKAWIMSRNRMLKFIVKIENLLFFIAGLVLFHNFSNNWLIFILLFLVPDISMVGYLKDKRVGSIIYNLIHNYILAIMLVALGLIFKQEMFLIAGSILFAHVGIDRFFGYGLKYKEGFKKTHIQKL